MGVLHKQQRPLGAVSHAWQSGWWLSRRCRRIVVGATGRFGGSVFRHYVCDSVWVQEERAPAVGAVYGLLVNDPCIRGGGSGSSDERARQPESAVERAGIERRRNRLDDLFT
jgi:hypothetical protein